MSKIEVNTVDTQCGTNLTVGAACKSVTVAGNDIRSNAYKAGDGGNLVSQSGTTITIGASGDTVSLASGASQSGFGRSGSVDWQTTKKTASFTAVSGEGYFVDTSSSAITATLPASPSAGAIVYIKDYDGSFDTNACTVARNGSNIRGATNNFTLEKANSGAVFIYVDATEGWQVFIDGSDADAAIQYISATGGTITTSGNYKIHTFTGPGTFTVNCISCSPASNTVSYMVVAGGGASGRSYGGGGGAGGFREYKSPVDCYTASPLNGNPGGTAVTVTAQAYPITVGGGGTKAAPSTNSTNGANSVFATITSTGGGRGGHFDPASGSAGGPGGSGGAGADGATSGGTGNTPPVSPAQGTNGGNGFNPGRAGGGGGATAAGQAGQPNAAGTGGAGATTSITGSPTAYAGGGGGFGNEGGANGGTGGGGAGGNPGVAGTANTGGGAGGSGPTPNPETTNNGGSGIVVIRYKFQS